MILAVHAITGGLVGEAIDQPFLAFSAGFFLHFILDSIPHFDCLEKGKFGRKQWIFSLSEFVLGLAFILFYLRPEISLSNPFVWGMIGGLLPDFIDNMPLWSAKVQKTNLGALLHNVHVKFHSKIFPSIWVGMAIQLFVIISFLVLLR